MNARAKLDYINNDVIKAYKHVYGNDLEAVYIYGSYARNEELPDSDIDYVALINRRHKDIKKSLYDLWDCTGEIDLAHDVVVSAMAVDFEDFMKNNGSYPYYVNVTKDGIKIYDKSREN